MIGNVSEGWGRQAFGGMYFGAVFIQWWKQGMDGGYIYQHVRHLSVLYGTSNVHWRSSFYLDWRLVWIWRAGLCIEGNTGYAPSRGEL